MSTTLNLVDRLLARGRHFQKLGRDHDALHVLGRLATFRELPQDIAEETEARLAEIHLRRGRPRKARRHLTAALAHQPDNARYHELMGRAVEADARADPERALEHYRRALELDPDQPECLRAAGLLAVRLGQAEEGLRNLRRATEIAPDDPDILGQLVTGLCLAKRDKEAASVLRISLFRHPRDARFRKLRLDFQFDQLRHEQEAARLVGDRDGATGPGPTILPFVRPTQPVHRARTGRRILRHDGASGSQPPHRVQPATQPDHRHAQ
jgi:tetratricopeptide (TPR) repeat protein